MGHTWGEGRFFGSQHTSLLLKGASSGKRTRSSRKCSAKHGSPKHVYAQTSLEFCVWCCTTDAVPLACLLAQHRKRRDPFGGRLSVIFGWWFPIGDAGCRCFCLSVMFLLTAFRAFTLKTFRFLHYGTLIWHFPFTFVVDLSCVPPFMFSSPTSACKVVPVLGVVEHKGNDVQRTC